MPAGILPFKREHAFTNVSPRYLEIHQKEKREYIPPEPTRYETQRQWQSVSSRYLQGVLHHEQEQLKRERENRAQALSGGDHNNPLAGWEQAESHREYIKRHIGNVGPRYADHFNKQNELQQRRLRGGGNDDSDDDDDVNESHNDNNKSGSFLGTGGPIRKKRSNEEVERERGWRGTHALNRHTTFDVMYAKWMKKHADDSFMKRKKNSARSPVGDWLRGKGPLAEAEQSSGSSFNRSRTPNPDTAKRRAQSPWERSRSSDKFIGGEWKSVSRRNEGFDTIRKQTMYSNPQYRACEKHAAEVISHQRERKVESSFVPHVASLALAYQIPDSSMMMSTINHQSPRSSSLSSSTHFQNNNNTSRGSRQNSPQRNFIQHTHNSQNRNNNSPAGRRQTTTSSSSMMKMKSNHNNNNNNNSPSTRGRNKTAVYNIGDEEEEEQDDKNNKKVSVIEGGSDEEEDDDNDLTVPTTTSFSPTENRRQISNSPRRRL